MKLSTRSRYGVRMMIALARKAACGPVFLKDIASGENISEKYLSLIVIPLRAAGLIRSIRGAHGGYVLARAPEDISLRDILKAVEEDTCLVQCVNDPSGCERSATCPTRGVWATLSDTINEMTSGVTLAELSADKKSDSGAACKNAPRGKKGR
ncbi:MAG: Rrf2 family transcriptional regulator [Smithellaceae bacterium]